MKIEKAIGRQLSRMMTMQRGMSLLESAELSKSKEKLPELDPFDFLKIGTTPIIMPPTRENFILLCQYMNLKLTP